MVLHLGFGTLFNTELKNSDEITIITDAGNLVTRIVESIISNTSLQLLAVRRFRCINKNRCN